MSTYSYFTRCCWNGSAGNVATGSRGLAGGLRSGLPVQGPDLSQLDRVAHFERHRVLFANPNFIPWRASALVSVSTRLIDTVQRAFKTMYQYAQRPEDVYIVFIKVPKDQLHLVHSVAELADLSGMENPEIFKYEYVFDYSIPRKYKCHTITVKTLIDRGFPMGETTHEDLASFRNTLVADYFDDSDLWSTGLNFGTLIQAFGARAPLQWVTTQLLEDILKSPSPSSQTPFQFASIWKSLNTSDVAELHDGLETRLIDWWLQGTSFLASYEKYQHWKEWNDNRLVDLATSPECYNAAGFNDWYQGQLALAEDEAVRFGL